MDKRFLNLFNLTEDQAIALLDTPLDQLAPDESRYVAASHLVNFPTAQSIQALMRAVVQDDPALDNRIVRRKAIETLGRLKATQALPVIQRCLGETDRFTVENAVWAIGEIGSQDPVILAAIAHLLAKPNQTYRVIIQTLANADYTPALDKIRTFIDHEEPPVASAALTAVSRLSGDRALMADVVPFLQHPVAMARRLAIQDLMDADYDEAIPAIAQCPVSLAFRLRGLRHLAQVAMAREGLTFASFQPILETVLRDHPGDLALIRPEGYASHRSISTQSVPDQLASAQSVPDQSAPDQSAPDQSVLIQDLYSTDFGRCYFATQLLLQTHGDAEQALGETLMTSYRAEGCNDYGAHFHMMKLWGWLRYAPAYDTLVSALHNRQPQFQKSRAAAAIALGELGNPLAIPELQACLQVPIWDLQYAALMALERLGNTTAAAAIPQTSDTDWLVRAKVDMMAVSA